MANTTIMSPMASHTSFVSEKSALRKGNETAGKEVNDAVEQTSTAKKSGGYANPEIADHTRRVLRTEQHAQEGKALGSKVKVLTGRINLAAGANENLRDIASKFHARVTTAQQTGIRDANFSDFCKGLLDQVENILNKKDFDGRALFGGSATRSDAVKLSDAATPAPGDMPDANYNSYFKGEDSKHKSTLNGEELEYGFTALDPGARDLIFWLKSGAATTPDGDPSSPNTARLKGMQDGLHKVNDYLSDTQKLIGQQLGNVERIAQNNEDELAYNEGTLSELIDADLLEQLTRRTQAMMMQQMMMHMQSSSTKDFQNLINNI